MLTIQQAVHKQHAKVVAVTVVVKDAKDVLVAQVAAAVQIAAAALVLLAVVAAVANLPFFKRASQ
jgi:hypothetical protein